MSVVLPPVPADQRDMVDVCGVLIDDGAVFNLPILQKMLGQTEESTKKWAKKHRIQCIKGRSWIFTGKMMRQALERHLEGGFDDGEA